MKRIILLYIIPAVILIATAMFLFVYNKPHRSVRNEEPAYKLSVAELVEEFEADEQEAHSRYGGKVLQVRGPLKEMIRNDSSVILLMGDTDAMTGVSCYLLEDQAELSENLTSGETVSVKGICNGMLMDVMLDKGILLTDEQ